MEGLHELAPDEAKQAVPWLLIEMNVIDPQLKFSDLVARVLARIDSRQGPLIVLTLASALHPVELAGNPRRAILRTLAELTEVCSDPGNRTYALRCYSGCACRSDWDFTGRQSCAAEAARTSLALRSKRCASRRLLMSRASRICNTGSCRCSRLRRADDVEVFLAGFESIKDAIKEEGIVVKFRWQQSEVPAIQLNPEAFALQMLQPASTEITPPVALHPAANGGLTEIASRFLTFYPLIAKGFLLALGIDARFFHGLLRCHVCSIRLMATHVSHIPVKPLYLILTFTSGAGKLRLCC